MSKDYIIIGNLSDIGKKRAVNEDYYGAFKGTYGDLIIVCDGMGGYKGGATASRLAVDEIKIHFEGLPKNFRPPLELKNALCKANEKITQEASKSDELKDMGTTAVVLLIKDNYAYYAHIGDSRLYLIRNGIIYQLTKDHSLVQQLVDSGIIDEDTVKNHPQKNIITRSLSAKANNTPEIAEPISIFKDDIFILCTDGLSNYLSNDELLDIATKFDPQKACQKMVNLANERGGQDNITVQIVKVIKGKRKPSKIPPKTKLMLLLLVGLVFILLVTFYLISGLPNPVYLFLPPSKADSTKKPLTVEHKISDSSLINNSLENNRKLLPDSITLPQSLKKSDNSLKNLDTMKKRMNEENIK